VFFCFVFCHATENEEAISEETPCIGKTDLGSPPKVGSLSKRKAIFEKTPKEALTFASWLVYSFFDRYETPHCPRCTGRSICEPALQTTH
jgi:hypothetical protein